ncbi:MAG: TFIIB-type zinc ribbon-containing protein [Candidatus Asgardarchaeum sp.]
MESKYNKKHSFGEGILKCPECEGDIIYHNGEFKCTNCGLVLEDEYIEKSYQLSSIERLSFNEITLREFSRDRVLGSMINFYDIVNSFSKKSSTKVKDQSLNKMIRIFKKARQYNLWGFEYSSTQIKTYRFLKKLCLTLGIPESIQRETLYLYQKVISEVRKTNRHIFKNHLKLIAALLLIVIRNKHNMFPISLDLLVSTLKQLGYSIEKRMILSEVSKLIQLYGFKLKTPSIEVYFETNIRRLRNDDNFKRMLCEKDLDIDLFLAEAHDIGRKILLNLKRSDIGGRNPYLIAAAVTYASLKITARKRNIPSIITQSLLSKIINVPSYSIRDHYLFLKKVLPLSY